MTYGMTMTVRKVTISLESSLLARIDRLAADAGLSRSEWLAQAAERAISQDKLRAFLDRGLARTGGPLTREERDAALRELGFR